MENASKALIMAAEILFGMMLISVMVLGFYSWRNFSKDINDNIEFNNIQEFNSRFTKYDGRDNLTVHDVITIVNLANEYNKDKTDSYKIDIIGLSTENVSNVKKYIEQYEDYVFELKIINFNDKTKIVKTINIIPDKK